MEKYFLPLLFDICSERRTVLSSMQRVFFAKFLTKCDRPASPHRNSTDQPSSRYLVC